jgi:hypothetical protein
MYWKQQKQRLDEKFDNLKKGAESAPEATTAGRSETKASEA